MSHCIIRLREARKVLYIFSHSLRWHLPIYWQIVWLIEMTWYRLVIKKINSFQILEVFIIGFIAPIFSLTFIIPNNIKKQYNLLKNSCLSKLQKCKIKLINFWTTWSTYVTFSYKKSLLSKARFFLRNVT